MQSPAVTTALPDLSGLAGAALLDIAAAALTRLRDEVLDGEVDDRELHESVRRLARCESAVVAEKLRRVAAVAERGSFRADAQRSTADWLTANTGVSSREAHTQVRVAQALRRLPATAAALAAGQVTPAHAATAARGLAVLDGEAAVRERDAAGPNGDDSDAWQAAVAASERLVGAFDAAAASEAPTTDALTLGRRLDAWTLRHVPDAARLRAQRAAARRGHWWDAAPDADGLWGYRGKATAEDRAQLLAATNPLARRVSEDDQRTAAQRNLDAVVELARRGCASGDLPSVAGARASVLVIRHTDTAGNDIRPAWVDGVGPASSETAKLFACDADTTEFRVNPDGTWDLGRADGTPTVAQRKAVIARDQTCVGCGADASRCQLHHIVFRSRNGPTVIANLVLVCWSCHHGLHHLGWQITQAAGRYQIRRRRAG